MSVIIPPTKSDDSSASSSIDPFSDPDITEHADATSSGQQQKNGPIDPALILHVDRNASLTIAAESVVLLDEGLKQSRETWNCYGLLSRWTKATHAIPFRNVLWAAIEDHCVSIRYARPNRGGKSCTVAHIHYGLTEKTVLAHAELWIQTLMEHAYPAGIKRRKRIKVLINPFGGQGHAQQIWTKEVEPILAAAQCSINIEATAYRGHAAAIAETLVVEDYDVIAAASGDGLPHEIFNGLAKQKHPRRALWEVAVTQIPCGSGNALSLNTFGTATPSWAAVEIVKGVPAPLDLMAVTQGDQRFYSFLSQAVGIVAESDLGTESLRWLGSLRFQWGVLVRIFGQTIYPAEISIVTETKDKEKIKQMHKTGKEDERASWRTRAAGTAGVSSEETGLPPLRYGTVQAPLPAEFETVDHPHLGNFYTGNMPAMTADVTFFPRALLQDGFADLVTIPGTVPRTTALRIMTSLEDSTFIDFPEVDYRKVNAYRIIPRMDAQASKGRQTFRWRFTQWLGGAAGQTEGLIAIDGERMPFEPFQVEVHQGLGTTLVKSDALFSTGTALDS